MPKRNFPYVVSLDWLTVYCWIDNPCYFRGEYSLHGFSLRCEQFITQNYIQKCTVTRSKGKVIEPFCEILYQPKTSVLHPRSCHLRVFNQALYSSSWYDDLRKLLCLLHLHYRGITRVDVAADFNKLYNGLLPVSLIMGYVKGKYLKIGINNGYLAFKSMGYTIGNGATRLSDGFRVNAPEINGITWGRKGYIQTQLYNKTLELATVKYKPWIVRTWEAAGLDPKKVWRLEFRIQKAAKGLQLLDSNELFALGHGEVSDSQRIIDLFMAYADKYARFVERDYHIKKQQMTPVKLFGTNPDYQCVIKPKIQPCGTAFGRTTKIVANYLETLEDLIKQGRLPSDSSEDIWHLWHARQLLRKNIVPLQAHNKAAVPNDLDMLERMEAERPTKQQHNAGPVLFDGVEWRELIKPEPHSPDYWIA